MPIFLDANNNVTLVAEDVEIDDGEVHSGVTAFKFLVNGSLLNTIMHLKGLCIANRLTQVRQHFLHQGQPGEWIDNDDTPQAITHTVIVVTPDEFWFRGKNGKVSFVESKKMTIGIFREQVHA